MKYRRLGNSGLLVSELALGTMVFGEQSGRGTPEADALRHGRYVSRCRAAITSTSPMSMPVAGPKRSSDRP